MSNEALNFATAEPFELMAIVADRFRRLHAIIGANIGRSEYIELYERKWQNDSIKHNSFKILGSVRS